MCTRQDILALSCTGSFKRLWTGLFKASTQNQAFSQWLQAWSKKCSNKADLCNFQNVWLVFLGSGRFLGFWKVQGFLVKKHTVAHILKILFETYQYANLRFVLTLYTISQMSQLKHLNFEKRRLCEPLKSILSIPFEAAAVAPISGSLRRFKGTWSSQRFLPNSLRLPERWRHIRLLSGGGRIEIWTVEFWGSVGLLEAVETGGVLVPGVLGEVEDAVGLLLLHGGGGHDRGQTQ